MAEIVTSVLLNLIFEKLADEALKKLVRSQRIHSELKSLERTLSQIRALLTDASHKQITDKAVKQWLNSLQHLAYDIDDVLDDLATQVMHRELTRESGAITTKVRKLVPTCCTNILLSSRLLGKLDDINTKLQDLEKEKLTLGLVVKDKIPTNMSRSNETSLPEASRIVGREGEKEKLLNKLFGGDESCKDNFSIVPIVGMGGVGKTTLARLLYNETHVSESDHFQLKAWVCVPQEFDLFKISKTIFQAVTRENRDFGDLNQVQVALMNQLKEKRFLLVLDDIWSENYHDWENLVRPFHSAAPGSKIILTTRKEQLLKKLGFDHLDHLGSLSHDDALSLFAFHALGVDNFDSHPTLKAPGDGIVRKCGGLPLALGAVGRVLRTKTDKEDWDDVLNSEIWDLENADEIIPALRLSYQDLRADLKQLFAYCSLFPKGFLFNKEELVLLWMAEGFLNQSTSSKSLERLGHELFENLLSRSFFELSPNEESLFVMHDLMNDLSAFVAGEFFLKFEDQMEMEMESGKEALAKHRYMSFIRKEYVGCHKYGGFISDRSLRTLLATSIEMDESWNAFYFSNQIFPYLLRAFPLLRVLSFSGFCINEVPEFIGSLKLLRYLNLSRTKIKELPEYVGNLYNLQTLIVFGCRSLTKLPKSFLKLNKLRHFDIRDTPLLKKFPFGIGDLKSLQTLPKIIIGGDSGFAITKLQGLKNLRGTFCIEGLEKVESVTDAREAHLSLKTLTELELKWGDEFDDSRKQTLEKEVLNELKPHSEKLKKLGIVSYGGIEFPKWVGDPSFQQLVHVSIRCCRKCTSLPALGRLPFLKELFIEGMNEVKVVDSELLGTSGVAFPSLEILRFKDMLGWEVWSTKSDVADVVFPHLRELQIQNCTDLVNISIEALPSLRVLEIESCGYGVLRSLLLAASSITNLKLKKISKLTDEAWRGVMQYLGVVEEVRIESCDEITYLWESEAEASKVLVNLKELIVFGCSSLVSLGEREDDFGSNYLLSSLRMLQLWFCTSMDHCCCPGSIESLHIFASSVTSVSFSGGGQKLDSLQLVDCDKLIEKINITSMPMLEYVHIVRWPNLKSIIELSTFIHVKFLMIKDCQNLESFPHLQLPKLTSLELLEITNCPSMDASFPCGLWPPNLHSLEIGGLKKPISEWGPQNFPTSLVHIQLSHEHVTDFSQLSHLLPSSLTSLRLREFENLESLLVGLQHLNSLEQLVIDKCPKMIHLPETLLPSLFKLILIKCPNLDKMFQERSSHYVPLVSNIPCFLMTNEEVIY